MGFEGDQLDSSIPAVDEVPLETLYDFENQTIEREENDVPLAQFQSSV